MGSLPTSQPDVARKPGGAKVPVPGIARALKAAHTGLAKRELRAVAARERGAERADRAATHGGRLPPAGRVPLRKPSMYG